MLPELRATMAFNQGEGEQGNWTLCPNPGQRVQVRNVQGRSVQVMERLGGGAQVIHTGGRERHTVQGKVAHDDQQGYGSL